VPCFDPACLTKFLRAKSLKRITIPASAENRESISVLTKSESRIRHDKIRRTSVPPESYIILSEPYINPSKSYISATGTL